MTAAGIGHLLAGAEDQAAFRLTSELLEDSSTLGHGEIGPQRHVDVVDRTSPDLRCDIVEQPAQPRVLLGVQAIAGVSVAHPDERFCLVHSLPTEGATSLADADEEAWTLFEDPSALQRWMTDRIRENIAENHGVTIPVGG